MDITIVKLGKVVSLLVTLKFTPFSTVSIVDFEQVNVSWVTCFFVATRFIHSASLLLRQPVLHFIHSAQVLLITYRYVLTKACCVLYLFFHVYV